MRRVNTDQQLSSLWLNDDEAPFHNLQTKELTIGMLAPPGV
jgi:hypothetical protein